MKIFGLNILSKRGLDKITAENKYYNYSQSGYGSLFGGNPGCAPSTFLDVITAGKDGLNYDRDPRQLLATYRAIVWALPYFKQAMTIHQDMTGCPEIESEDEGLQRELRAFWDSFDVTSYRNKNYKIQRGADAFKNRLMQSADSQGIGFAEIKRDERGTVNGSIHYNPEMFTINDYTDYFKFCYATPTQGTKEIESSSDFIVHIARISDKWEWGLPMVYNAEYFATCIASLIESRISFEAMFGNPLLMNFMTNTEPTEQFSRTQWNETEAKIAEFNTAMKTTIAAQKRYRSSSVMNMALPSNIKIDSTSLGSGVTGSTNVPQLIEKWTEYVMLTTECPPEFLGLSTSAGIGSDRFRIAKSFLLNRAKQNQYLLEPHLNTITNQFLISQKANPRNLKNYKWKWERPNIDDDEMAARVNQIDATTMQMQLTNLATIRMEGGPNWQDMAEHYAEEIDKPYLFDAMQTPPPIAE